MAEPNRASIGQRLKEGCEIERAVAYDQDVRWLLDWALPQNSPLPPKKSSCLKSRGGDPCLR